MMMPTHVVNIHLLCRITRFGCDYLCETIVRYSGELLKVLDCMKSTDHQKNTGLKRIPFDMLTSMALWSCRHQARVRAPGRVSAGGGGVPVPRGAGPLSGPGPQRPAGHICGGPETAGPQAAGGQTLRSNERHTRFLGHLIVQVLRE